MDDRWLYGWALGYVAVGAASLLIPLYAMTLGGGPLLVGVLASTAAFAGVPGALLWGRLASRARRRRPFVLVALAATAAVLAATPLIRTPWLLVAANAALWFVVSAAAPVLNLVVVDGLPEDRWESSIGLLNAYQGYGWVCGLLVGTVWTAVEPLALGPRFSQVALFWLLAAIALAGLVVVRIHYPEPVSVPERRFRQFYRRIGVQPLTERVVRFAPIGPERAYWAIDAARAERIPDLGTPLWRYMAAVAVFSVGFAVFWAPMPAYLVGRELATGAVFALFLVSSVGSAVSYARVRGVSSRLGLVNTQTGALAVRGVLLPPVAVVGGLSTATRLPLLGALFAAIGATWAVVAVTATAIVARVAPAPDRAEALGLYTAVFGAGSGLGSIAGGALATHVGYGATFTVAATLVLVAAGITFANVAGPTTGGPRPLQE